MSIFKKEELLSSNRFEVLDSLGEEVLILDPDYKIVYANQKFLDNREKSFSEVKGRFCYQLSHNLDKPCPVSDEVCPLNKVLKNSAPVKVIHKDDGRYMEIDASPLKNKGGKIIGIVEILRDVPEKEREKRESEEKYKNLVEKSNDAILILQHNRIKLANQKFLDLTGYSWEEIERSDFMEGIAPESRDMVLDRYLRRQKGEEVPDHYEFTILTKDGKRKEVEAGVAIIEYQGKVASYCFLKDVTAKKKAEDELKKVKDYLDNMISTSQVAITVIDNEGSFSIFNQGAEKLTGYKAEEVIGKKKLSDFCPDKEELEYIQTKLLEERLIENFETTLLKRDGSIVPVSISVSLLKDLQGKSIGSLGISTGIAERKKAEQEVFRQNAVLGAINKVLQETLVCETDEEVARKCLAVAEELTNSKFGFIGEVNQAGHFDTIALSDPGWDACRMPKSEAVVMIKDMEIRGIWGRALKDRKSLIVNHPVSHPDRVGTPEGHPPITSFLGVLLKHAGRSIGMIGLANKEFGYDSADQEAIEALSVAFVEALYRKRAEEALRKSEEKYRFLYEKNPTVNLIIGIDGKIKDINESAIKKFGYSKDEIIGKQALEFVVPEQRGKVASQLERDFKGEYTPEIDVDINAKDGSIHTILFSPGNIILYEGGQPTSILITGIDITERKKAEEALRRSEERFRHFASAITDVICRYDPLNNRYDFISPSFERQTGYPLDEINQDPQGFMRKITHPEDVERVFSEVDAHIKKGPGAGQICTEYRLIRKNGEVIWVSDRKDIEFDSEGKVYRINGVVRDITQRKKAEEEIYYLKEFNQEIVEKLPIGVIRLDKEGEIVYENPKMREILGVEKGGKSKALGMKITQMPNVIESDTVKPLENLLTGTPFAYLVIPSISLYGKKTILSINGVPLFDQVGKPDGAILL
ncbi:MAG: PAS domain S-box protein, partial [Candidatus Zixiibacteriota bacterium]